MRSLDFLELDNKLCLASWIAVGVVLKRECAERFADLVLAGVGRDFQVAVVISRGISFDHGGRSGLRRAQWSEATEPVRVFVVSDTRQTWPSSGPSGTVSLPVS